MTDELPTVIGVDPRLPDDYGAREAELIIADRSATALAELALGVNAIANFLAGGGLSEVLGVYARTGLAQNILGGLAAHGGRDALDARVLEQNAVEIVHQVESFFDKLGDTLGKKRRGEVKDPEIHEGEKEFRTWVEKQEAK